MDPGRFDERTGSCGNQPGPQRNDRPAEPVLGKSEDPSTGTSSAKREAVVAVVAEGK